VTDDEEKAHEAGRRSGLVHVLMTCARELGHGDPLLKAAAFIAEREAVVVALRRICAEHGDNDWDDDLHLADVIEKHLGCYLDEVSP
jgi:hypothetical protein